MSRTSAIVALVLGAAFATPASAQSWGEFGAAFKLLPCSDGWAGCRVEGQIIQPDMVPDSQGMPSPSHMRVGWFDLKATSSFSPFTALSEYTGELQWAPSEAAVAAADVEPEPEPIVAEAPSEEDIVAEMSAEDRAAVEASAAAAAAEEKARREAEQAKREAEAAKREQEDRARKEAEAQAAAEAARRKQADLERQRKELESRAAADAAAAAEAERLRKEAEAARKAAEEAERKRKEEEAARKAAEEEQRRKEAEAAKKAEEEAKRAAEAESKRKAEEEARKRAEDEAKRKAEEEAERKRQEAEAKRKADEEARKRQEADAAAAAAAAAAANNNNDAAADAAAVAPPPAGGSDTCGLEELVRLEPQAMLGKLSDAQIAACEQTLATAAKMTDKAKVSLVLQVNAFSKGDKATWEKLVKRHLNEIDQSDPDLCYKYALHLSKMGAGRASGVIRWSDVALENRIVWTGDTYTSRVFSLYKLRAVAAQSLWEDAEKSHAEAPSDDSAGKVEKYRSMTKVMAREWYEYAKVSGKDTTKALQLCMSAAGTKDYCEAG